MTARLDGQVILVTGSTAGLGRDMAVRFASAGAQVIVTGRNRERGEHVAESIGEHAIYVAMDMANEADVERAVAAGVRRFGKLTGLVNNAATIQGRKDGPLTEIATEDWLHILNTDLAGTYYALKHGLRAIANTGGGSVVNISSAAGMRGQLGNHAYTAAKGAIQALTRALATYYSRYCIRVNCLVVGTIDTGEGKVRALLDDPEIGLKLRQHYLGRVGEPREVSDAAAFLLSQEASFINGVELAVDNGVTAKGHAITPAPDMIGVRPPANRWV